MIIIIVDREFMQEIVLAQKEQGNAGGMNRVVLCSTKESQPQKQPRRYKLKDGPL